MRKPPPPRARRWLLVLALAVWLAAGGATAATTGAMPAAWQTDAAGALAHLATLREADGSFDAGLAPLLTEAVAAQGLDAAAWPDAAHPVLASLRPAGGADLLAQVRAIHARAVAGHPAAGDEAAIAAAFHDGQYGEAQLTNDDLWALRALQQLRAAASAQREAASAHALHAQGGDGGWSWRANGSSSSDVTGMALEALRGEGVLDAPSLARAIAYLGNLELAGGGVREDNHAQQANCDSTVWAIRGLTAAGASVPSGHWDFLATLRSSDGGYAYARGQPSNALCTAEVATLLGQWGHAGRDMGQEGQGPPTHRDDALQQGLLIGALAASAAVATARRRA